MRLSGITCLFLIASTGVVACSGSGSAVLGPDSLGSAPSNTGGDAQLGGAASQGGSITTGGSNAIGGAGPAQTGGSIATTGGAFTNGGSPSQGGNPSLGGTKATGGSIATGGIASGAGGVLALTGGNGNPTGGVSVATGGSNVTSGGSKATGGVVATGGTTTVVNCSDTPPPNGDTCQHAVLYNWCGAPWMNGACAQSCNLCGSSGATGGAPATGGTSGAGGNQPTGGNGPTGGSTPTGGTSSVGSATLPPINGGSSAWASRYWDCCKPACGWTGNSSNPVPSCSQSNQQLSDFSATNACQSGGTAYMCWSGIPRAVSDSVSYGFAAASGTNYSCGQCFQIQFDGGSHNGSANAGTTAISGKQMIIQVINNGGVAADQFDLLIPGGGVGALNACSTQWGSSDLGAQYGGFLSGCNGDASCVQTKCNTIFAGKSDLLAGCNWFLTWFHAADNPTFKYQAVNCPSDFKSVMGGL